MYCVIKCIVRGNQARVKNADLRHPCFTVVMQRHKSATPVYIVLRTEICYTQIELNRKLGKPGRIKENDIKTHLGILDPEQGTAEWPSLCVCVCVCL